MQFAIISDYPFWFVLICLLCGGLYSFILYYKGKSSEFSKKVRYFLAASRFLLISLIVFLLFAPLIKSSVKEYEHPLLVLAHDNSSSLILSEDSAFMKTTYLEKYKSLTTSLEDNFECQYYLFGDSVRKGKEVDFEDNSSDLSLFFTSIASRLENRSIGAIVFFSDGIYNQGLNPLYAAKDFGCPIFTVALGDTSIRKDAWILHANYNSYAYKGNSFPIEVILNANKLKGEEIRLRLYHDNKLIDEKKIIPNQEQYSTALSFQVKAEKPGIQHYRLEIPELSQEANIFNNNKDIYVEIIEEKQKILLLYNGAHPDVAAIKSALQSNINYELEVKDFNTFNADISKYDMLILHQLPSQQHHCKDLIAKAEKIQLPIFFVFGSKSDYFAFNTLKQGFQITVKSNNKNDAYASYQEDFSYFKLSSYSIDKIESFPPLQVAFGEYKKSISAEVLFQQKIGTVHTTIPLISIIDDIAKPRVFIFGEGIWRWRLNNYKSDKNHDAFNELINKLTQFLAVKEQRKRFQVKIPENLIASERLILQAELYDRNFEPVSNADIGISIINPDNKNFSFQFIPSGTNYSLGLGRLKKGKYSYKATAKYKNEVLHDEGEFIVEDINAEALDLVANHKILHQISAQQQGSVYYPHNMSTIIDELKELDNLKPTVYYKEKYKDLIDWEYLLLILLLLASLEWIIRKYKSSY